MVHLVLQVQVQVVLVNNQMVLQALQVLDGGLQVLLDKWFKWYFGSSGSVQVIFKWFFRNIRLFRLFQGTSGSSGSSGSVALRVVLHQVHLVSSGGTSGFKGDDYFRNYCFKRHHQQGINRIQLTVSLQVTSGSSGSRFPRNKWLFWFIRF